MNCWNTPGGRKIGRTHSIGTECESSLHRALKVRYAGTQGKIEQNIDGFIADGISADGEFIEIQTGSFAPLRKKVLQFAKRGTVRIVCPVVMCKYIEVYQPAKRAVGKTGTLLHRRKSPRKGSPWDLFAALLYAPELALSRGVSIELALVDVTEKRLCDGKGSWRRKGISIIDKKLAAWRGGIVLKKPQDYLRFVPFKKEEEFTTSLLAKKAGISIFLARKTLWVLTSMRVVKRVGKQGNAIVYTLSAVR